MCLTMIHFFLVNGSKSHRFGASSSSFGCHVSLISVFSGAYTLGSVHIKCMHVKKHVTCTEAALVSVLDCLYKSIYIDECI